MENANDPILRESFDLLWVYLRYSFLLVIIAHFVHKRIHVTIIQ